MEDDVEESQPLEQPTKLPAWRYYGLLFLVVVTLAILISGVIGAVLGS